MKMMRTITKAKLEKYLSISEKAIKGVRISAKKDISWQDAANDFLDMAGRYLSDARHYHSKGDYVTAFASVNYAHGWLDAGARLGLFKVDKKVKGLFVID